MANNYTAGKLQLCIQLGLELFRILEKVELESSILYGILFIMVPFIIGGLWNLGISLLWQMFYLGVKFGIALAIVSYIYFAYLKYSSSFSWKHFLRGNLGKREVKGTAKCTYLDILLTIFFETGLGLPTFVWDNAMDLLLGGVGDDGQENDSGNEAAKLCQKQQRLMRSYSSTFKNDW